MKQKTGRKLLGVLLALSMVVGLVPGMSLTAYAATNYDLWIGGTQVTSDNLSGIGWSYDAGTNTLTVSVSCSTFKDEIISQITEADLYEALNAEMQANFAELNSNNKFSDMKTSYQKTTVDGCPAYIATATYVVNETNDKLKSTLVYLFKGSDMWRIIFDYRQSDDDTIKTVDNAVNNIKLQ